MLENYRSIMRGLLSEAPEPPKTRVADKVNATFNGFEEPTSKGHVAHVPKPEPSPEPHARPRHPHARLPGRVARQAPAVELPPQAAHLMNRLRAMGANDEIHDEVARLNAGIEQRLHNAGYQEPGQIEHRPANRLEAPPNHLPAVPAEPVRQNQLVALNRLPDLVQRDTGQNVDISWHRISSLPGYLVNFIRGAFRPFFRHALGADLEDILMASTFPGAGSSHHDIEMLWDFLLARGVVDDQFDLEAFGIDPEEYHVGEAHIVQLGGNAFFIMKERIGGLGRHPNMYIYVAPGKGRETRLDGPGGGEPRRLGR